MVTLTWTTVDSDGSIFTRGKQGYYAILVRGVPEQHPKDCIIELYLANREMTISAIKFNAEQKRIRLLSRIVVRGNLSPAQSVVNAIAELKNTAEIRDKQNSNGLISSSYTTR